MKQFYLLALFCLIFFNAYSQKAIDGIGPIRLGKPLHEIISKIEERLGPTVIAQDIVAARANGHIYSVPNEYKYQILSGNIGEHKCGNIKAFFIPSYEIANIHFTSLALMFYNDTLYSIYSEGSQEINDAIEIKYGKGKSEISKKEFVCQNGFGAEFKKEGISSTTIWRSDNRVECYSLFSIIYDSDCEKIVSSQFELISVAIEQKIAKCDGNLNIDRSKIEKSRLKERYKNF